MTVKSLIEEIKELTLGPAICDQCGQKRFAPWSGECKEEGQCDWNRDYGLHTDGGTDVFKLKRCALAAAEILSRLQDLNEFGAFCSYPNCDCAVSFPRGFIPSWETQCPRNER